MDDGNYDYEYLPPATKFTTSSLGSNNSCGRSQCLMTQQSFPMRRTLHSRTSLSMVVSLAMLMVCSVMATPLSLTLTIPAYILATKAQVLVEEGEIRKAKNLIRWSYALNGGVAICGVLSVALFVFLYVATVEGIIPHRTK